MSKLGSSVGLAVVLGLGLNLNGCIATGQLDYQLMISEDAKWVADEQYTDTLIAVGKPSIPIKGLDNAIVFAGEKQSYVVQTENRDSEFIDILDQVDLAYFSFKPMPPSNTQHFEIRIDEKGCRSAQSCMAMTLWFEKPTHLLATNETSIFKKLEFNCDDGFAGGMTRCTKNMWHLPVTVAPAVSNIEHLQHKFSPPTTIKFYTYQPDKGDTKQKRLKALMPFAKAFDIITFPIQFIIVEGVL